MPGLFETIRVRAGLVPFLERHLARLAASCGALGQAPPRPGLDERVLGYAAGELVVRVTLEGPAERIEARAVPPGGALRVAFSDVPHQPYPHKLTERGVFERARARADHQADEVVLLTPEGLLAEGSVTSLFFWQHDTLCTPALELGILPGVGRARVLELARERGVPVREGRFTRDDCAGAPLFLVNSVRGVVETVADGPGRQPEDVRTALLARSFWG